MAKAFWAGLFGPSRERFSLEELHHLHGVLVRNAVVDDGNRDTVVEALRSISELVIWCAAHGCISTAERAVGPAARSARCQSGSGAYGPPPPPRRLTAPPPPHGRRGDQHDPAMVEYFLTENLLGHFHQILRHPGNRRGEVAAQVLQSLSILIQNVRTQQTVYYLFSNDHISGVAALRLDFEDDEVLGYYVNLLKTISLRLDAATVQLFFRPGGGAPGAPAAFPLFTEACKLIAHRDGMVRAAVKTLTLNVFAIELPALRRFLALGPARGAFARLAADAAARCAALGAALEPPRGGTAGGGGGGGGGAAPGAAAAAAAVEAALAEVEDLLSYCNDVLAAGVAPLSALMLDHLWRRVVGPVLFWPLIRAPEAAAERGGAEAAPDGRLCALYVFERLFHALTDAGLLSLLASALLGGPAKAAAAAVAAALGAPPEPGGGELEGAAGAAAAPGGGDDEDEDDCPSGPPPGVEDLLGYLGASPAAFRAAFMGLLRGGDAQLAAAAGRVLAALLGSRSLPDEALEAVGLLPRRRRKQRELMEALTREGAPPQAAGGGAPGPAAAAEGVSDAAAAGDGPDPAQDCTSKDGGDAMSTPPAAAAASRPGRYSPRQESWPPSAGGPDAAPTAVGESHFDEAVSALLGLLEMELLPPAALCATGWTLHKLLAAGTGGADLRPAWRRQLAAAAEARRAEARPLLRGTWCDALGPLTGVAWARCRPAVLRTGAGPLHAAAAAWAQGAAVQELHWQLGGAAEQVAAANASAAARLAWACMHALVAVLQIREVRRQGGRLAALHGRHNSETLHFTLHCPPSFCSLPGVGNGRHRGGAARAGALPGRGGGPRGAGGARARQRARRRWPALRRGLRPRPGAPRHAAGGGPAAAPARGRRPRRGAAAPPRPRRGGRAGGGGPRGRRRRRVALGRGGGAVGGAADGGGALGGRRHPALAARRGAPAAVGAAARAGRGGGGRGAVGPGAPPGQRALGAILSGRRRGRAGGDGGHRGGGESDAGGARAADGAAAGPAGGGGRGPRGAAEAGAAVAVGARTRAAGGAGARAAGGAPAAAAAAAAVAGNWGCRAGRRRGAAASDVNVN
jgi:hypothetical protein